MIHITFMKNEQMTFGWFDFKNDKERDEFTDRFQRADFAVTLGLILSKEN